MKGYLMDGDDGLMPPRAERVLEAWLDALPIQAQNRPAAALTLQLVEALLGVLKETDLSPEAQAMIVLKMIQDFPEYVEHTQETAKRLGF